ncbi:C-reactive protein-like isoform X2 [Gracilinanus agilis]|uniref:C-reactive protein-like isoform X2 n=1 Tax=Gracilinanus agilis TaxID=191870 RepID=UPI001CFDF44E|nr:C-reactive protein-like isoform X2 [Gracilinanus agilis]
MNMEKLPLCFLVITSLSNALPQNDLSGKAFVFPKQSQDSYVTLIPQLEKSLNAFTVCLKVYSELTRTTEINIIYTGGTFSPNVLDWRGLNFEKKGYVVIKPKLWV